MKIQLTLCAIIIALMSTNPASATGSHWGGWTGHTGWNDINWGWVKDKVKDKIQNNWNDNDCDWGHDDKKKKKQKKKKGKKKGKKNNDKCDPPVTAIPSPTAAIAGLGVMGLMLTRRRNKKA